MSTGSQGPISAHDQRMQQIINALQSLQNSGATDNTTQQLILIMVPLVKELQAIRMALVEMPLPTRMKNLDI